MQTKGEKFMAEHLKGRSESVAYFVKEIAEDALNAHIMAPIVDAFLECGIELSYVSRLKGKWHGYYYHLESMKPVAQAMELLQERHGMDLEKWKSRTDSDKRIFEHDNVTLVFSGPLCVLREIGKKTEEVIIYETVCIEPGEDNGQATDSNNHDASNLPGGAGLGDRAIGPSVAESHDAA